MATFESLLGVPIYPNFTSDTSFFGNTLNSSAAKIAFVFQTEQTMTINKLGFRIGAVTGTSPYYRISLQGVNVSGLPDNTIKGSPSTPASGEFRVPSTSWNNTVQVFDLTHGYDATEGELLSIVVDYASGTVSASHNISSSNSINTSTMNRGFPYPVQWSAGYSRVNNQNPIFVYGSGTTLFGNGMQSQEYSVTGASGNKVAYKITMPTGTSISKYKVEGLAGVMTTQFNTQARDTYTINIEDSSNNIIATNEVSGLPLITFGRFYIPFTGIVDLTPGESYYFSLMNRRGTELRLYHMSVASGNIKQLTRLNAHMAIHSGGLWYNYPNNVPMLFPVISDIEASTGSTLDGSASFYSLSRLYNNNILNSYNQSFFTTNNITNFNSNKIINGYTALTENSDIIGNGYKILSGLALFDNESESDTNPSVIIQSAISALGTANTSTNSNLIIHPALLVNNESIVNNYASLIANGTARINIPSNVDISANILTTNIIKFLSNTDINSDYNLVISQLSSFAVDNNVTVVPNIVIGRNAVFSGAGNITGNNTKITTGSATIFARNTFSLLPNLFMRSNAQFNSNVNVIANGALNMEGNLWLSNAVLDNISNININSNLIISNDIRLIGTNNTNVSGQKIILPSVVLNSASDISTFGNLLISSSPNFNIETLINSESYKVLLSNLILSNNVTVQSDGRRVIHGVLVYDTNSLLNLVGDKILSGSLNFNLDSLIQLPIQSVTIIPIELTIAKDFDLNFSINKEFNASLALKNYNR